MLVSHYTANHKVLTLTLRTGRSKCYLIMKNNDNATQMAKAMLAGTAVIADVAGYAREISFDGKKIAHEDVKIIFKALGWKDGECLYFRRLSENVVDILNSKYKRLAIISITLAEPFFDEPFARFVIDQKPKEIHYISLPNNNKRVKVARIR